MRILYVTPLYLPYLGGLEVLAGQLLAELRERGHEVSVLTSTDGGEPVGHDVVDGIDVRRTDAHAVIEARDLPGILRVQRETWEHVRDLRPDVVHAHDAAPSLWLYVRAARHSRPPIVLTLHNVMTEQFRSTGADLAGLRTVLREADRVTGVSPDVVADALTLEPSIEPKLSMVTNGVAAPSRAWTPVPDGPPTLLCVGRLVPAKGFDRGLEAVAALRDHHPDLRLVVAGDGVARDDLVAQAARLGIGDRVEFTGRVARERVDELMAECTLVLMPSHFEGLPLVALEAAWLGRPVVGTRAPGLAHAVVDGVTGTLVDADTSPDGLTAAVDALLTDRARTRRYGRAARARAEQEFTLSHCVDQYLDHYRALHARSPDEPGSA
jgi:glycogen(starch) synthase